MIDGLYLLSQDSRLTVMYDKSRSQGSLGERTWERGWMYDWK